MILYVKYFFDMPSHTDLNVVRKVQNRYKDSIELLRRVKMTDWLTSEVICNIISLFFTVLGTLIAQYIFVKFIEPAIKRRKSKNDKAKRKKKPDRQKTETFSTSQV